MEVPYKTIDEYLEANSTKFQLSLEQEQEKWLAAGRVILATIGEIFSRYMQKYHRQQRQRGLYVHRRKGKPLRQHRMARQSSGFPVK